MLLSKTKLMVEEEVTVY